MDLCLPPPQKKKEEKLPWTQVTSVMLQMLTVFDISLISFDVRKNGVPFICNFTMSATVIVMYKM